MPMLATLGTRLAGSAHRKGVGAVADSMPPEKDCPDCGGIGEVIWETHKGNLTVTKCSGCMGTGKVPA